MKTTLELSFDEICLICEMANKFVDKLDNDIYFQKDVIKDLYEEFDDEVDERIKRLETKRKNTMELWEKIEKVKTIMIGGKNE